MVSTRSRGSLHSGDAGGQAGGQPEVSSAGPTPRRSSRLSRAASSTDTPNCRARTDRAASKRLNLDIIEEEAHPPAASPPAALGLHTQEEQQGKAVAAAAPAAQAAKIEQLAAQEDPTGVSPAEQRAAGRPDSSSQAASQAQPFSHLEEEAREKEEAKDSDSGESSMEEEEEGEEEEAGAGAGGALLGANPGLLDKVASEMFAALEGAFGGGEDVSEASSSEEEEMEDERADHKDGAAAGDTVPRHLRWEPELQLQGMEEGSLQWRQQQQQRPKRPQQQAPLAKQLHVPPPDERALRRATRGSAPDTAGKQWFDLPATAITDDVKRDLRMLRLRSAFDPKSFYKKLDNTKFPKHFQMGTVVAGAADFYSGRLTKSERKRTFTEEIMTDPHLAEVRKKRFNKLQEEKSYWSKKKAARKTENERLKKKPRKAKH